MIVAMKSNQQLIEASRNLCKADDYQCPSCKSPVHLKVGAIMRPHFGHYQNANCDVFSEGETAEHIQGKLQLKQWLEDQEIPVELEAYLPGLRQRPDLLATIDNRKIALEFQCSQIPIYKIAERTQGYLNNGYEVIWVLGDNFEWKNQLTAFQKSCLTNLEDRLVLFHYSVTKKRLSYRYNFTYKQTKKMRHTKKSIKYGQKLNLNVTEKRPLQKRAVNTELEHTKLLRQITYSKNFGKAFLETLYNQKETLVSMPKELYEVVPSEWMIHTHGYEWKYQFILWLEQLPVNSVLTKKNLLQFVTEVKLHLIPQATTDQLLEPIIEFLAVLTESGALKQLRLDKWSIKNYPKRYKYLEEKFK